MVSVKYHSHRLTTYPRTNRLVEAICIEEHISHGANIAHVPRSNILIERRRISKHIVHFQRIGHIPLIDGLAKVCETAENTGQVGQPGDTPVINIRSVIL